MRRTQLVGLVGLSVVMSGCVRSIIRAVVKRQGDESVYVAPSGEVTPTAGSDAAIEVQLVPLIDGFTQPVDLAFLPGSTTEAVVLERTGGMWWVDLGAGEKRPVVDVDVVIEAEQGLLGIALHPEFADNGRFFLNYTIRDGRDFTIVSEWQAPEGLPGAVAISREILRVEQPYQNHNGGGLVFGPDGMLYIGLGDGGARDDLHGHAQDGTTLLGSMLRLDVDGESLIPADNPFVGNAAVRDEAYAIGFRNPWRYSFTPSGQLVVADVGQDVWEEIDLVEAGDNLGWRIREGTVCFDPAKDCDTTGLTDPIYTYDRSAGASVTGGYVVTGSRAASLQGQYVFGDFVSGRLWALSLPDIAEPVPAVSLGTWPLLLSTFGLDAAGDLYVVDFGRGAVYAVADPGWTTDQAVTTASAVGFGTCAACHGAAGEGSEAMKAPALAGMPASYLTEQLQRYRDGRRPGAVMPPLAQSFSDADIAALSAEIAAMSAVAHEPTLDGDAAKGEALYTPCAACHGAAGEGSEALKAPPLVGLQDWYITSQLAAFAAGEREEDAAVMTASVAALPDAEAHRDVAAYILTLGR